jgi:solute carrier family 25 (mitochondrial citrate transporter), member 1
MQLSRSGRLPGVCVAIRVLLCVALRCDQTKPRGFLATGALIVQRETPLALYKGLGAVLSGIVPKMAIRFASFETYKGWLSDKETGKASVGGIFVGLCSLLAVSIAIDFCSNSWLGGRDY